MMNDNKNNERIITKTVLFDPNIIWDHILFDTNCIVSVIHIHESHFDHNYGYDILVLNFESHDRSRHDLGD